MSHSRAFAIAVGLLVTAQASPARADFTAFLGANTTPASRQVRGGAVGSGLLIIGFEVEYSATPEDPVSAAPSLKTGMGNIRCRHRFRTSNPTSRPAPASSTSRWGHIRRRTSGRTRA